MRTYEFTFEQILQAFRHHWRCFVITLAVFLALGIASGFAFSGKATAEGSGGMQKYDFPAFEQEPIRLSFYHDYYTHLTEQLQVIKAYLNATAQDTTITAEQKEEISALTEKVDVFSGNVLDEIEEMVNDSSAIYIPDGLQEDAIKYYKNAKDNAQMSIEWIDNAKATLESMDGLSIPSEKVDDAYLSVLVEILRRPAYVKQVEVCEGRLAVLENDYGTIQQGSQNLERMLNDASKSLDDLAKEMNELLEEIAQTNHIFIERQDDDKAEVIVNHTHRLSTQEEAFSALLLFFVLTGICIGCVLVLWRAGYTRKQKKTP